MKVRFVVLLILLLSLSLLTPTSIADGLGSRNLRLGMRGADVELLQEYLLPRVTRWQWMEFWC